MSLDRDLLARCVDAYRDVAASVSRRGLSASVRTPDDVLRASGLSVRDQIRYMSATLNRARAEGIVVQYGSRNSRRCRWCGSEDFTSAQGRGNHEARYCPQRPQQRRSA